MASVMKPSVKLSKPPSMQAQQNEVSTPTMGQAMPGILQSAIPVRQQADEDAPVDLQADDIAHDDESDTVIARGNVMLVQAGRILRADEISYNLPQDRVIARGDVVLNEPSGEIHYADEVELQDHLKNGFVKGLRTYMADGSRFMAREGHRVSDPTKTVMRGAAYTPCTTCVAEPDKSPLWEIKAAKVTHYQDEHRVSYNHARFEVKGVPVAYVPYFSHPDGTVKRKSGFLAPSGGYKSSLGAYVTNRYYWDIAPDKDMTIGLQAMTRETPLGTLEWRQRWERAEFQIQGGITESSRDDSEAGMDVVQEDETRGHVFARGRWDINENWRSGLNVAWASDDQYMRQYDFSDEDVLENELYVERFAGRNYAAARLLTFQDIRVREERVDQPEILPEIEASFIGDPGGVPLIKGRWNIGGSLLGLRRDGSDQDVTRLSGDVGWKRRLVSDLGLVGDIRAASRVDFYNARDRDIASAGSGISRDVTETQTFSSVHGQVAYPVARNFDSMQVTIEPVVAVTVAENIDSSNDIPNEDSQDVQIDASNLFEPNRFPGRDRIEDKSHVTYGLRTGAYGYNGNYANFFLGQSYRFDDDDNPFPAGSGLTDQHSDFVGQVSSVIDNRFNLNYRFQLSGETLASQRHEIDAFADWNKYYISSRYLYAKALGGTDIDESREQLRTDAGYYLDKDWRVRAGGVQDFGDNPGLREGYVGLDYFGQCVFWSVEGKKNYTSDSSGESDTEIVFRIGLKNLGEFEESKLRRE